MYRYKAPKKLKKEYLKYILINTDTKKAVIYRFKTELSYFLDINPRTLNRNIEKQGFYSKENYIVYLIKDIKY